MVVRDKSRSALYALARSMRARSRADIGMTLQVGGLVILHLPLNAELGPRIRSPQRSGNPQEISLGRKILFGSNRPQNLQIS